MTTNSLTILPFEDIFEIPLRNGLTRPTSVRGSGVKMVNMGELFAHSRIKDIPMDRVPLSREESDNYLLKNGDLLFARQSLVLSGAGKCSIFLGDPESVTYEGHIIRARLDSKKANSLFYYYYFNSPRGRSTIESIIEQVAAAGIRASDLAKIRVPVPPVITQLGISHILGSIDDMIELNIQMNETLEAMAQAIFKSWFVDFDPVWAKFEGRQPSCMDAETAALFPNDFEEIEGQDYPKGWLIDTLGNVIDLGYGRALKEDDRLSGDIPVFGSNGQIGWHNEKLTDGPGIIIGRKGNPGTVTWSAADFFAIDTTFYVIQKTNQTSLFYLYHELQRDNLQLLASDSAVPGLNRNFVYLNKILIPPKDILNKFDTIVNALNKKIQINNNQSLTLAKIRDLLLSKLVSRNLCIPISDEVA